MRNSLRNRSYLSYNCSEAFYRAVFIFFFASSRAIPTIFLFHIAPFQVRMRKQLAPKATFVDGCSFRIFHTSCPLPLPPYRIFALNFSPELRQLCTSLPFGAKTHATMLRVPGSFPFFFRWSWKERNRFKNLCGSPCALFRMKLSRFHASIRENGKHKLARGMERFTIPRRRAQRLLVRGKVRRKNQEFDRAREIPLSRYNPYSAIDGGVMQMSGDCEKCGALLKCLDKSQE